jgi:hypothetical protein
LEGPSVLIELIQTLLFLPFFLYAETHYRFRFLPSLLKKLEPEVIADLPHRLDLGQDIPLLVIVKDAHKNPARLLGVRATLVRPKVAPETLELLEHPCELTQRFFSQVFHIARPRGTGWLEIDVAMTIEIGNKRTTYHNDNHITSSHRSLRVFLSESRLPSFQGLVLGDPHTHSNYTDDQVEFGSPLAGSRELCRAMGLSYFCVTDHSYDLDDRLDSFLENDPSFPKWKALQKEIDDLNADTRDFAIVRGEEVTCRNADGANVHCLVYGQREFIQGSGDGAERWFQTRSENTIGDVVSQRSSGAIAIAAHAREPVPFLQRVLLGRGIWSIRDLDQSELTGLQIINGRLDRGFEESYRAWTRLLLEGRCVTAIAGNDAHGNFNRFRQIGIPFLQIRESDEQIFGKWRTGVILDQPLSECAVIECLSRGRAIMSDGPVLRLSATDESGQVRQIGETISPGLLTVRVDAYSSKEFGAIESIRIFAGVRAKGVEQMASEFHHLGSFECSKTVTFDRGQCDYLRAETATFADGSFDSKIHQCYTNAIWVA